jgi:hypothetical protein
MNDNEKILKSWAENEVEIACKKENKDWDGKSFDYACSCFQSALKAYKTLENDGHSGFSWNVTKNILTRLMDGLPLTPITDEDFNGEDMVNKNLAIKNDDIISEKQCPRMSSLFRKEKSNGEVYYTDINRVYCINIHNERDTFSCGGAWKIIDKLFPIKMPYYPIIGKYKVFTETFLTDENNGDFDTHGFIYAITPENEKIELNVFEGEVNGKMTSLTKEQYEERKKKAIKIS